MIERVLSTDRGEVHYWINSKWVDQRETLVFLHGLTADHSLFDEQVADYEANFSLIVWDAPAHGKSRPYRDFSYPNAAADLKQILDENAVTRPILIGQSMGGFIAQSFLLRYPEMARGFIGIDTCPYGESYYSRLDRFWLRQVGWMASLYPEKLLKYSVAKSIGVTKFAQQKMRQMLEPYGKKELCRLMDSGFGGFLDDNCDMEIPCPVMILLGEYDHTGKVQQYDRMWAECTGYPLVVIPNAAHNSTDDNPEDVNRAIARFILSLNQ